MQETTAAPTAVENANPAGPKPYQIDEAAIKSLRSSRHSRLNTVTRNHSGNSRDQSPTQQQLDTSRYSNRSSTSSLWSSLLGRGRRIYGSACSIASSITLTEFEGNLSEDFEISDESLDVRQFANQATLNDSKPHLPQRQSSVDERQQSSSSLPPALKPKKSSDLSPRQPGRKTSVAETADIAALTASIATERTVLVSNRNNPLSKSIDSIPLHPSRKKSSKIMEGLLGDDVLKNMSLQEKAQLFRENLPLASLQYQGKRYELAFNGAEAIDHMVEVGLVIGRPEGVELAIAMQKELKLFHHVAASDASKVFQDDEEELYQLTPSLPGPSLLSVRRKTDTSVSIQEEAPWEEPTANTLSIPHTTITT